jgi:hypothetical protein
MLEPHSGTVKVRSNRKEHLGRQRRPSNSGVKKRLHKPEWKSFSAPVSFCLLTAFIASQFYLCIDAGIFSPHRIFIRERLIFKTHHPDNQ